MIIAGPDDPFFKRFKKWYKTQANDAREHNAVFPDPADFNRWEWTETSPNGPYLTSMNWWARSTLTWVQEHLVRGTFPREDYRELCELINIVLGGEVSCICLI
jgi:hypothetical protein